jgi:hypothetical protein
MQSVASHRIAGVSFSIAFSHRVKPDAAAPGWVVAPPPEFQLDCFWAQARVRVRVCARSTDGRASPRAR